MLAALLLNLDARTPPPAVRSFFGGGPFLRRYGYDWDVYGKDEDDEAVAQEAREALPSPKAEKAEAAIHRAVEAIRNDEPEKIVLDAQRIYERVFLSLRGELRAEVKGIIKELEHERVQAIWRAEVKRRIQQEDEEICLMFL